MLMLIRDHLLQTLYCLKNLFLYKIVVYYDSIYILHFDLEGLIKDPLDNGFSLKSEIYSGLNLLVKIGEISFD